MGFRYPMRTLMTGSPHDNGALMRRFTVPKSFSCE